jgi:hypothetical protein
MRLCIGMLRHAAATAQLALSRRQQQLRQPAAPCTGA